MIDRTDSHPWALSVPFYLSVYCILDSVKAILLMRVFVFINIFDLLEGGKKNVLSYMIKKKEQGLRKYNRVCMFHSFFYQLSVSLFICFVCLNQGQFYFPLFGIIKCLSYLIISYM